MILYQMGYAGDVLYFTNKAAAIAEAKDTLEWVTRNEKNPEHHHITVDKIEIDSPSRSLIVHILNGLGFVKSRETIWSHGKEHDFNVTIKVAD